MKPSDRYRGLTTDGNYWIYGLPRVFNSGRVEIFDGYNSFYVIPETVGQYVGVKGYNDEYIFDGDKVKGRYYVQRSLDPDAEPQVIDFYGVVNFAEGCYYVKGDNGQCVFSFNYQDYEIEVVGNIHEPPH